MNRVELKEKAKNSLKGKYGDAILMIIIMGALGALSGVFNIFMNESAASLISSIVSLVVSALFTFGYTSYFMKVSRNEEVTYKELWSKTNMFVPYIVLSIVTFVFVFLWSILFIIPGIIAAISYSLAVYIMLDNPEMKAMDAIKKSKEMMQGHKMDYFVLQLSFLGWSLLGICTCGILYFWLIPYMQVTNINFYNKLKELSE